MNFLKVFFALVLGCSSVVYANHPGFKLQYVKPIVIKIFSSEQGNVNEEYFRCTPETCCFSERFYCFMEDGKCLCDLHICNEWPDTLDSKTYWMELTGTEAERYCGRSRLLHTLTNLCICDPDKNPPCSECNLPTKYPITSPSSLPQDCRPY